LHVMLTEQPTALAVCPRLKRSAKGLLRVEQEGNDFVLYDQQSPEQEAQGALQTVFRDGKLLREESLSTIRQRLWAQLS
jgi:nicotinamide phosphoribosyltransferase